MVVTILPALSDNDASGIAFNSLRLIYSESAGRGITTTLNNQSKNTFMVQSQIMEMNSTHDGPSEVKAPFMVVPPLMVVGAESNRALRVVRTGGEVPADRESVFFLVSHMAPSVQVPEKAPASVTSAQDATGSLRLGMNWTMKVFWRPAGLPDGGVADAVKQLTFRREGGNTVVVTNPGPFWITLSRLDVNGKALPDKTLWKMVPAKGEARYSLPSPQAFPDGKVNVLWQAIDEKGYGTEEVSGSL
nr:molecular chaperone [Rahnella aceris]